MFEKEAKERARKIEERQTLGVYDNDEDLARDIAWNEGEVAGYEEGFKDGAEFVKEQKISKGFYVYNPAGSKPSHIHETLEEAKAEAERIFKLNLNVGIQEPIEVLEIVARCVPEIKIKWS